VAELTPLAFAHPAIVALIGVAFLGDRLTAVRVATIVLALGGSVLLFGAPSAGDDHMAAKALAFTSGLCAAVYFLAGARWIEPGQAFQGTALVCLLGTAVFVPVALVIGPDWSALNEVWLYLALMTLFGTVVPFVLVQAANSRLGPGRTALLNLLEPVVAIGLAVIVLDESMTAAQVAGSLAILASFPLMALEAAQGD
jgi:drug/metabolite transporter (DMT)-like permease